MRELPRAVATCVAIAFLVACDAPEPPAARDGEAAQPRDDAAAAPRTPTESGGRSVWNLLDTCKRECVRAFQYPNPDEVALLARLATAETKLADAREWDELVALVARIRARDSRMRSDPRYLAAERKLNWVRENPMFRNVRTTWAMADPYVVIQEVKEGDVRDTKRVFDGERGSFNEVPIPGTVNPARRKQNDIWKQKAEELAVRSGLLLTQLERRFRELFATRANLPTLAEKELMLTVLVMWDQNSFIDLMHEAGQLRGGDQAFYSPRQQKVYAYVGDASLQGLDELPCAGGRVQKESDQTLAWVVTQQLIHEYAAIAQGRALQDHDKWAPANIPMWFSYGFAELMSAVEVPAAELATLEGASWFHERVLVSRIDEARRFRTQTEKWTLAELMKPNSDDEVAAAGRRLELGDGAASRYSRRAWGFCHFLWHYDGGKYRERLVDAVELVLKGTLSSERFALDVMKRPGIDDWGPVEMEFEWYWQQLLVRRTEQDQKTRVRHTPSTDPPTGRVEDDPDFVELWSARQTGATNKKK